VNFLPIFMNIKGQPCLVIGGGDVASRKVFLLLRAGGDVTVVSPELCDELQRWHEAGDIKHIAREFEAADIDGRQIVIAATDDEALAAFHDLTRTEGIIPALESSHALAYAAKLAPTMGKEKTILVNLSGRGDKDIHTVAGIEGIEV